MGHLRLLIFHHCTKFGAQRVSDAQIMAKKTKFKMAAAAILNLLPVAIFDFPPMLSTTTQNLVPISQSAAD